MSERTDVEAEVGAAALLDTSWLDVALTDEELLDDVALWGATGDGATDVLARHPSVGRLVATAITSPRPQVRATLAARRDLEVEHYCLLADDEHPTVRARVAANPASPRVVVDRLRRDPDLTVRQLAQGEAERRAADRHPCTHWRRSA